MSLALRSTDRRIGMTLAVAIHAAVMVLLLQTWTHFPPAPRDTASTIEVFVPIAAEAENPEVVSRDLEQPERRNSQAPRSNALAIDQLSPPPSAPPSPPIMESPLARTESTSGFGPTARSADGVAAGSSGSGSGGGSGSGAHDATDDLAAGAAPVWIRKPTEEQVLNALSFRARDDRQDGYAILSCLVTPRGHVRDCKVLHERTKPRPAFGGSYEFGRSALRLSRHFLVEPPVRDGQPRYDVRVRIPISWTFK